MAQDALDPQGMDGQEIGQDNGVLGVVFLVKGLPVVFSIGNEFFVQEGPDIDVFQVVLEGLFFNSQNLGHAMENSCGIFPEGQGFLGLDFSHGDLVGFLRQVAGLDLVLVHLAQKAIAKLVVKVRSKGQEEGGVVASFQGCFFKIGQELSGKAPSLVKGVYPQVAKAPNFFHLAEDVHLKEDVAHDAHNFSIFNGSEKELFILALHQGLDRLVVVLVALGGKVSDAGIGPVRNFPVLVKILQG